MNKGDRVGMKSELMEQVITAKPSCSEGHVCFAVQRLLLTDDVMPS